MTIKDLARERGISLAAVYKRIRKAGIQLDQLRDKETGILTEDGERTLMDMFGVDHPEENQVENRFTGSEPEVQKLKTKVQWLENRVQILTAKVEDLERQRDFLQRSLEAEQQALERAQQLQAMTVSKIPSLPAPDDRPGFFDWLKRKKV